jgi:hypothetical protein
MPHRETEWSFPVPTKQHTGLEPDSHDPRGAVTPAKASIAQRLGGGVGGLVGFVAASVFPKEGNVIAAGVIGAVCAGLGAGVGHAVGSFVDELLKGPPDEDPIEESSAGAVVSLVLGLFGLIAWILPIVGLPVGALGYFLGRKGTSTRQRTTALIGIGLCVLCLCLSVVNAYVGALLAVRGKM